MISTGIPFNASTSGTAIIGGPFTIYDKGICLSLELLYLCRFDKEQRELITVQLVLRPHMLRKKGFNLRLKRIQGLRASIPCVLITCYTGRIQIRVLTSCQAISTEIGTESLKIQENFYSFF